MLSRSITRNQKAKLAADYNDLLKELSSHEVTSIGFYSIGETIGQGSFGKVKLGTHKLTGKQVAIKKISKEHAPLITREIHLHRQLKQHPNIVTLYEIIMTESFIHVISEYCPHGELFDALTESGRFSEHETIKWFSQLVDAIYYCHSQDIVHRDLKLENILLDQNDNVKLCDFGFARHTENKQMLQTFCGSLAYSAPEVILRQKYTGPETDIWSLGVILYTLLAGELPFDDDSEIITQRKIVKGDYVIPSYFSKELSDLITRMLKLNPSERVTLDQIIEHPWLHHHQCQDCYDNNSSLPSTPNSSHSDLDSIFSTTLTKPDMTEDDVLSLSSPTTTATTTETYFNASTDKCSTPTIKSDRRLSPQDKFSPQVRYSLGIISHEEMSKRQSLPSTPPRSPRFSAPISNNNNVNKMYSSSLSLSPPTSPYRASLPSMLPSQMSPFRDNSNIFINNNNSTIHDEISTTTIKEQQLAMTLKSAGFDDNCIKEMRMRSCDSLNGLWNILLEQNNNNPVKPVMTQQGPHQEEQIKSAQQQMVYQYTKAKSKITTTNDINSTTIGVTTKKQYKHAVDASTQTVPAGLLTVATTKQNQQSCTNNNNVTCSNNSLPLSSATSTIEKQQNESWFVSMKTWFGTSKNGSGIRQKDTNRRNRRSSQSYRNVDAPLQQRGNKPRRYWDHDIEPSSSCTITTPTTKIIPSEPMYRSLSNQKHKRRALQLSNPPENELDQYDYNSTTAIHRRSGSHHPSHYYHIQKSSLDSNNNVHQNSQEMDDDIVKLVKPPIAAATPSRGSMTNTLSIVTTGNKIPHETKEVDICEKRYSMMTTTTQKQQPSCPSLLSDKSISVTMPPIAASSSSSVTTHRQPVTNSASLLPLQQHQKHNSALYSIIATQQQLSSSNIDTTSSYSVIPSTTPSFSSDESASSNSSSDDDDDEDDEDNNNNLTSPPLSLPTCQLDNKPIPSRPQNLTSSIKMRNNRIDYTPRSRLNVYGYNPGTNRFATKAIIEEEEEEE
ncbi:hypothetical protein INT45_006966 [Circinella minor]|uniref:Protein kinase domain-containing protein n=1 Tax=Circinella minor TaxID=1195481 RepID=A0A8H7S3L8_9FUNG|nr:hypothetical protein INT45_006966 [Circinella minor]